MSDLHAALRSYRSSKAAALSQPAFCVFSNAELDALVAACPHSTIELAAVKGFGRAKVQKFGDDIVRIRRVRITLADLGAHGVSAQCPGCGPLSMSEHK